MIKKRQIFLILFAFILICSIALIFSEEGAGGGSSATTSSSSSGGSSGGGGGGYSSTNETILVTCIGEGDKGSIINNNECCPGLSKLANSHKTETGCIAPSDGSFICSNCGNGICESGENSCNCEKDCCKEGDTKKYKCSDGSEVQWCFCNSDSDWACIVSPETECSTPTENTTTCPIGCICNENTIACSTIEATPVQGIVVEEQPNITEVCPSGCICNANNIVCETNNTTKTGCIMGCELNGACVLPGIRTSVEGKRYCDVNSEWKEQKKGDEVCDNNFECDTNLCINAQCISESLWQKFLDWLKNLFG